LRLCHAIAVSMLLLGHSAVSAEEVGPAQAEALQQQLQDWLAGLLGPAVKLPKVPWQVRADHDHYVITRPTPGLTTPSGEPAVTATLRPLDRTRWSIDSLAVPASGSFSVTLPQAESSVRTQFAIRHQDARGVIDPTFNSRSQLHSELSDVSLKSEGSKQSQEQRFDRHQMEVSLTPTQSGRLDLLMDGMTEGWNSASQAKGSSPIAVGIQKLHAVAQVNGISRDRLASLLTATGGVIGAWPADLQKRGEKPDLPPALRKQMRLVVEALHDMLTSVTLQETLDNVQVEMAGVGGMSIKRFLLGMGGAAPDGRLHAWVDLEMDELASPSLPPNIAAYLPHRVKIKPSLSGVLMADLHKVALDATEDGMGNDRFAPDVDAIFAHGGFRFGLETLSFDLGSAKLDGSGEVTVVSPDSWHGAAHLVATGFDDLTAQARNSPELQSALPALIMLRGLAKQDGERLVWDVVSDGPKTTVNGLDLSQLAGTDKSKSKSPAAQKPGQKPSR
jgi:hypothetical protein